MTHDKIYELYVTHVLFCFLGKRIPQNVNLPSLCYQSSSFKTSCNSPLFTIPLFFNPFPFTPFPPFKFIHQSGLSLCPFLHFLQILNQYVHRPLSEVRLLYHVLRFPSSSYGPCTFLDVLQDSPTTTDLFCLWLSCYDLSMPSDLAHAVTYMKGKV